MSVVHRAYNCSRPQKVQVGHRSANYNRLFTRKIFFLSYLVQMYPVPLPYFPALLETDAARPPIPSDFSCGRHVLERNSATLLTSPFWQHASLRHAI
jgi:hypothetical protein